MSVIHERLREEGGVYTSEDPTTYTIGKTEGYTLQYQKNASVRRGWLSAEQMKVDSLLIDSASGNKRVKSRATYIYTCSTSCTKKKSWPASWLLTAFGLDSVLSLHVPISVSEGKDAFIFLGLSSRRLPAQLAPIWNVYGGGVREVLRRMLPGGRPRRRLLLASTIGRLCQRESNKRHRFQASSSSAFLRFPSWLIGIIDPEQLQQVQLWCRGRPRTIGRRASCLSVINTSCFTSSRKAACFSPLGQPGNLLDG